MSATYGTPKTASGATVVTDSFTVNTGDYIAIFFYGGDVSGSAFALTGAVSADTFGSPTWTITQTRDNSNANGTVCTGVATAQVAAGATGTVTINIPNAGETVLVPVVLDSVSAISNRVSNHAGYAAAGTITLTFGAVTAADLTIAAFGRIPSTYNTGAWTAPAQSYVSRVKAVSPTFSSNTLQYQVADRTGLTTTTCVVTTQAGEDGQGTAEVGIEVAFTAVAAATPRPFVSSAAVQRASSW